MHHNSITDKDISRFLSKIAPTDPLALCNNWLAGKNKNGYGLFRLNGKILLAHRVAWLIKHGAINRTTKVLHKCDNPSCVNVDHLFLGTQLANIEDRHSKDRDHHPIGNTNPNVKLSENEIMIIRDSSESLSRLSARFGVSKTQISKIKNRKSWSHL